MKNNGLMNHYFYILEKLMDMIRKENCSNL